MDLESHWIDVLARRIMTLGYTADVAYLYASLIGDTPQFDRYGQVVVTDESGTELVKLPKTIVMEVDYP